MKKLAETKSDSGFSIRFANERVRRFEPRSKGSNVKTELIRDGGRVYLRKLLVSPPIEVEKMKLPHNCAFSLDGLEWQSIWNN